MMDRLSSMSAFVMAAELGSYARAAERLGMSPQMVAKHVAALERRLGARLLNRTTRRQSLTELGSAYYERCKHILTEAEAADSLAQIMNDTPRGKLKISAPVTFGSYSLMPLVTEFLRDNPEVEIDLHLTDRFVDLVEEGYEVAFRIGPLANSSLTARPLQPYRLVVCAAPKYLAERGTPLTPADLEHHECLGYAYWSR
ncbi:MAG: LysR family transcriptional regulator, partial [Pseudomonas sp.]